MNCIRRLENSLRIFTESWYVAGKLLGTGCWPRGKGQKQANSQPVKHTSYQAAVSATQRMCLTTVQRKLLHKGEREVNVSYCELQRFGDYLLLWQKPPSARISSRSSAYATDYLVVQFTNLGVDMWGGRWESRFQFRTPSTNRNTSCFMEDTLLAFVGESNCFRLEFNIPNKFLNPLYAICSLSNILFPKLFSSHLSKKKVHLELKLVSPKEILEQKGRNKVTKG